MMFAATQLATAFSKLDASELAGSWRDLTPTGGLPLYQSWGMEDVGVFIDFSSIHQARLAADQKTLLPRFPADQKSYGRAVSGMSGWFANLNTTLYLVFGQDRRLSRPRAERGWPTYEERMASLLKQAPTPETYQLASGKHQTLWPKTVILNGKTRHSVLLELLTEHGAGTLIVK